MSHPEVNDGFTSPSLSRGMIVIEGDYQQTANGELVAVLGSMTFQSEYLINSLQDASATLGGPTTNLV